MGTMKKLRIIVEVALIIALFFTTYNLYQQKQENERHFSLFVNHFYFNVSNTLHQVDRILDGESDKHLQESFETLQYDLEKTHTLLEEARGLVDHSIIMTRYFQEMEFVATGIHAKAEGALVFEYPPFAEDNKIDEDERAMLLIIKKDLEQIKQGMYSEETGQEDPNLSLNKFNQILKPIDNKSVYEVHNQLLEEK